MGTTPSATAIRLRCAADSLGTDRILLGTDFPYDPAICVSRDRRNGRRQPGADPSCPSSKSCRFPICDQAEPWYHISPTKAATPTSPPVMNPATPE